jgi:hypothetical protein
MISAAVHASLLYARRELWVGCFSSGIRRGCVVTIPCVYLIEARIVTKFKALIILSNFSLYIIWLAVEYLYLL